MKIVATSDTHAGSVQELPTVLLDRVREADIVIHAGDYTSTAVLDQLRKLASFRGVFGNMDPPDVKRQLPDITVFDLAGCRIGVTHPAEGGPPSGIQNRIRNRLEEVDLIVYGHTHNANIELKEGVLFVNPGSAMGRWPATRKTFAVIEADGTTEAEIVEIH